MDRRRAHKGLLLRVARELGVTRAAVTKWRRVPAERVLAVERISGVSRHDLRPDLYPPPWKERVA
jgi:DNA-binding transcriptional regulator YdaS (Cro superfamily)